MNAVAHPRSGLVSEAACEQFQRDGYFVLPAAIPPGHLEAMRATCDEFIRDYDESEEADAPSDGPDKGTTSLRVTKGGKTIRGNVITQKGERYFLQGRHGESPAMQAFLHSEAMAAVCAATLGPDAYLYNEQFVVKAAGGKGDFSWHQDSGYAPYEHKPYVTVWCALDAATVENGTIYVLPYGRAGTRDRVEHVRMPGTNDAVGYFGDDPGDPVEVPAGSIVVFSSTMFHRSGPNTTGAMRRAFIGQFTREPFMTEDGSRLRWFAEPVLKGGAAVPAPQASAA